MVDGKTERSMFMKAAQRLMEIKFLSLTHQHLTWEFLPHAIIMEQICNIKSIMVGVQPNSGRSTGLALNQEHKRQLSAPEQHQITMEFLFQLTYVTSMGLFFIFFKTSSIRNPNCFLSSIGMIRIV